MDGSKITWRRIIASALWVSLASTANADFCRSARQAITYEALIASGDEISAAMIADLHETAASLVDLAHKHRPPLDGAALQAVQEYAQSTTHIQVRISQNGLQNTVLEHQSGLHRVKTRYLRAFTDLVCNDTAEPQSRVRDDGRSGTADPGSITPVRNGFYFAVNAVLLLGFLVVFGAALFVALRIRKTRLAQLARHHCHVPATALFLGGSFDTNLVDISAVGLKIQLPEGQTLPPVVVVNFHGTKAQATVAWQNAFFAGLIVHPPLTLDLVASVSKGRIAEHNQNAKLKIRK